VKPLLKAKLGGSGEMNGLSSTGKILGVFAAAVLILFLILLLFPIETTSATMTAPRQPTLVDGEEHYLIHSGENFTVRIGANHFGSPKEYSGALYYLTITKADNESYYLYSPILITGFVSTGWYLDESHEWTFKVVEGEQIWYWAGEQGWIHLEWSAEPVVPGEYVIRAKVLGDSHAFIFEVG